MPAIRIALVALSVLDDRDRLVVLLGDQQNRAMTFTGIGWPGRPAL
jgi:hypothetical protein